ncbi:hypothetical protein BH23CHL3_BH23CHL3_09650 [soil metagenome]
MIGKDIGIVAARTPAQSHVDRLADLAALLSSQVRARVLAHVVTHPDSRWSLTELGRTLELAVSSVQHECYKLESLRVLRSQREGSSRRYALQSESLVVEALTRLVVATVGVPLSVEMALSDLPGLDAATLLGAIPARVGGTALVLIGDLSLETVEQAQHRVAWLLDAADDAIEIAFFRPEEWLQRRDAGHPLVRRLLDLPVHVAFGEVRGPAVPDA